MTHVDDNNRDNRNNTSYFSVPGQGQDIKQLLSSRTITEHPAGCQTTLSPPSRRASQTSPLVGVKNSKKLQQILCSLWHFRLF